jgi:TolB-like protein/Tfp pilus assembly protein PilF
MVSEITDPKVIQFHPYTLDLKNRELRKQGRLIKLQPQPLKVLALLVSRPNEVVSRLDIKNRLWSEDTFVDFDQGINFCIKQIRTALGDDAAEPRFLQTLPRRGYRFIAPLRRQDGGEVIEAPHPPTADQSGPARNHRRIAVLPFTCICPEGKFDYVSDGLTEELIVTLSKIKDLRLIARTSVMKYKGQTKSVNDIGHELSVGTVLEGSVRTDGTTLRINAELVDTSTQETLWSQEYDREFKDLFTVQSEIAQRIAEALKIEFANKSEAQLERGSTTNVEAFDLYARGRFFLAKRTEDSFLKAVENFQQAIQKEPTLASAYAGLAECFVMMSLFNYIDPKPTMPKAEAAATRALELDQTLSDAHTSLALVKMCFDWDLREAEIEFNRAIGINPSNASAHLWYALFMAAMRRLDEEVAQIERARELDPLSLPINAVYGAVLRDQGRYDRAVEHLRKTIEMEPGFPTAHFVLAGVYAETGMYEEWIQEYETALALAGAGALARTLAHVFQDSGYKGTMQKAAEEYIALSHEKYVSAAEIAGLYAEAGRKEEAIHWLEKAYEERDPQLIFIGSRGMSPSLPWRTSWHHLRSDPRFETLLKKLELEA